MLLESTFGVFCWFCQGSAQRLGHFALFQPGSLGFEPLQKPTAPNLKLHLKELRLDPGALLSSLRNVFSDEGQQSGEVLSTFQHLWLLLLLMASIS